MTDCTIFRQTEFREGRWRNGQGVSWDIASIGPEADFDWRFALARIDGDVPFSAYPGVDRVFTLIEGGGLDLDITGIGTLGVHERFVPTFFPGDAACGCRLLAGPCKALNLFAKRGVIHPHVIIHHTADAFDAGSQEQTLLFLLEGKVRLGHATLTAGDAALVTGSTTLAPAVAATLYEARLHR